MKDLHLSPTQKHLCYCHTPMRHAWGFHRPGAEELPWPAQPLYHLAMAWCRHRDRQAASGVDTFVANSRLVAGRIRLCYGREPVVVPPPVDLDRFAPGPGGEPYLAVGRLVHYKRFDLAVEACTRLGRPLIVVGEGPARAELERRAGDTVRFLGWVSETELVGLYRHCRALLFPGIEDFGLVPVEAQACGRPVLAFAGGGALETVVDGVTGLFFDRAEAESLMDAIIRLEGDPGRFAPEAIREHATGFSGETFRGRMAGVIEALMETES